MCNLYFPFVTDLTHAQLEVVSSRGRPARFYRNSGGFACFGCAKDLTNLFIHSPLAVWLSMTALAIPMLNSFLALFAFC